MRALLLCALLAAPAAAADTGFLVLALDRGFLGNEETRDAFADYRARGFLAELAIVGRDGTAGVAEAAAALRKAGADRVVALPLAVSSFQAPVRKALEAAEAAGAEPAASMAGHPLAAAILRERALHAARDPSREVIRPVAQVFSSSPEEADGVLVDLARTLELVDGPGVPAQRRPLLLTETAELRGYSRGSLKALADAVSADRADGRRTILIPFDLGPKLDSMMSFSAQLAPAAARAGGAAAGDLTPHPNLALWLAQESNRRTPPTPKTLGIVFMPHGASERWNRGMMEAVAPLSRKWMIEPAFSMADPVVIERAIRRLEARGARHVAVLRVFSLESSFRRETEAALGLTPAADEGHAAHAHHHGAHAGHGPVRPGAGPLLGASALWTLGGIEDSPLFAEALADRARAISRDPAEETLFLLAHGSGDDEENERWRANLRSLADQVQERARARGTPFKAVRWGTWREDWPQKHGPELARIRAEVAEAARAGRALVVPARTAGEGPEPVFLKGIEHAYNPEGFAPHPAFAKWVDARIEEALEHFRKEAAR